MAPEEGRIWSPPRRAPGAVPANPQISSAKTAPRMRPTAGLVSWYYSQLLDFFTKAFQSKKWLIRLKEFISSLGGIFFSLQCLFRRTFRVSSFEEMHHSNSKCIKCNIKFGPWKKNLIYFGGSKIPWLWTIKMHKRTHLFRFQHFLADFLHRLQCQQYFGHTGVRLRRLWPRFLHERGCRLRADGRHEKQRTVFIVLVVFDFYCE